MSHRSFDKLSASFVSRNCEVDSHDNKRHVLHLGPNRRCQVEVHVIDLDPKDEVGRLEKWEGEKREMQQLAVERDRSRSKHS